MLVNGIDKSSYEIEREASAQRWVKGDEYLYIINGLKEEMKKRDEKIKQELQKVNENTQVPLI